MNPDEKWAAIAGQRRALAELLAGIDEKDWGLPSLAWTKMSYRPVQLLQKYALTPARAIPWSAAHTRTTGESTLGVVVPWMPATRAARPSNLPRLCSGLTLPSNARATAAELSWSGPPIAAIVRSIRARSALCPVSLMLVSPPEGRG